jgi:hypothetical protein
VQGFLSFILGLIKDREIDFQREVLIWREEAGHDGF